MHHECELELLVNSQRSSGIGSAISQHYGSSMDNEQEERREIEEYLKEHHLQEYLNDAVNDIVKERPSDPLSKLADALKVCSEASRQIQKVRGREILNGKGLPALEVEIQIGQVYEKTYS